MASTFDISVMSPTATVYEGTATKVVLPAFDGEVGVLPEHTDFIGILGTGCLSVLLSGNTRTFVVSEGLYQIEDGQLNIIAQLAEAADSIDVDQSNSQLKVLRTKLEQVNRNVDNAEALLLAIEQEKARIIAVQKTTS